MTYNDIYISALRYLGEANSTDSTADLRLRAPVLLAAVNGIIYREAVRYDPENKISECSAFITLEDSFPYRDELAIPAALMLASMLVLDSRETLSARLMETANYVLARYLERFTTVTSTKEVYGE